MTILQALYLVAALASIGGFIYAIVYARKSRRIKLLAYQTSNPVALATAFSPEDDYKLAVTYQRKGFRKERLESVFTRFLRFVNLGREPLRREDITHLNPIRIKIEGVRTLDIALAGVTRGVNNVAINNQSLSENSASADITFDYLDYKDGALIKILTVSDEGTAMLSGDIIGMPDGIKNIDEVSSRSTLSKIGPWLATLFVLSSLTVSVFSFYRVTGSWDNVWLLGLPLVALIIPLIIVAVVGSTIWPSGRPSFPKSLSLPDWYWLHSLWSPRYRPDIKLRVGSPKETLEDIKRLEEQNKLRDEEIKRLKDELRLR